MVRLMLVNYLVSSVQMIDDLVLAHYLNALRFRLQGYSPFRMDCIDTGERMS